MKKLNWRRLFTAAIGTIAVFLIGILNEHPFIRFLAAFWTAIFCFMIIHLFFLDRFRKEPGNKPPYH